MKTKSFLIVPLAVALTLLLIIPASALFVPTNGQAATLVLGQADFTSGAPAAASQSRMHEPFGVAVDPTSGKIFVADYGHIRVLRFADVGALSNGAAAEAVLGQPDFTSFAQHITKNGMDGPVAVAVDTSGRLWVVDRIGNRVLRFDNAAAKASGADADGVLGQPDFTSSSANTNQGGMYAPVGAVVDASGRLWVADNVNNRILRFDNAAAKANGSNADGVLGQPDFTSSNAQTTQSGMNDPFGIRVDASGRLWVAEVVNQRVLRFDNAAAKANGANADGVLGQADFTSNAQHLTQNGMSYPDGVEVDPTGRLYVAEELNNRILVFNAAASLPNGANANYVLGQTNFTTGTQNTGGISDSTLSSPAGVFYDPAAQVLWVADRDNNRVLMYGQPYAKPHSIMPFIGLVRLFLPPGVTPIGKISIRTMDGSIHTFDWSADTRILPAGQSDQLGVGSFVTLLARFDPSTGHLVAFQIIVHPEGAGPGFPTEIPTATATPAGVPTPVP